MKNAPPLTKEANIRDYFTAYKKLEEGIQDAKDSKSIKIAILSSFTIRGIQEVLTVKCAELGIQAEIYVAEYNQYAQEILDKKSQLYAFKPDLSFVFVDTKTLLGEHYHLPYLLSNQERKGLINEKKEELQSLISTFKENSSSKIVLHNFEVPISSPMGIVENKEEFGFIESIETINTELKNAYKNDSQVFVFDFDAFCARIGKENIIDYKMYYLGDMKINMEHLPDLCDEYLGYIKALLGLTKKCIVLDLDNTLWGGIVGEDGVEGIHLGPDPQGRPFLEFQKHLLSLHHRGILLAINSKNNFDDAIEVIKEHPYMLLREKHFAAMAINWNDKISNMNQLAEEMNIGLESLVFIDDDPLNREMMKDSFPEVAVVDLPEDPSLYLKTLMSLTDFHSLQITNDDIKRGEIYEQQKQRVSLEKESKSINQYLKKLDMKITIETANEFTIPRISQLTQKTNQLNMTTKRYLPEDIQAFAQKKNFFVKCIKVKDSFGDNGFVGVFIIEKSDTTWRIDTFLLSCRVIGRKIEEAMLSLIIEEAKKENINIIQGEFIPTKKNHPAKSFYKNNKFELKKSDEEKEIWEFDMKQPYNAPNLFTIIYSEH